MKKRSRLFLWVATIALTTTACASVGLAAWQIVAVNNTEGIVEDAFYTIRFYNAPGDSTPAKELTGLELNSSYDMPLLSATQDDLKADPKRIYFNGWNVGDSTGPKANPQLFANGVAHTPKALIDDLGSRPSDGVIHLWGNWGSVVQAPDLENDVVGDVLFDVTYNTSEHYLTLVPASNLFYLFNINVPVGDTQYVSGFTYKGTSLDINVGVDLTVSTTFTELESGQSRIVPLIAETANKA